MTIVLSCMTGIILIIIMIFFTTSDIVYNWTKYKLDWRKMANGLRFCRVTRASKFLRHDAPGVFSACWQRPLLLHGAIWRFSSSPLQPSRAYWGRNVKRIVRKDARPEFMRPYYADLVWTTVPGQPLGPWTPGLANISFARTTHHQCNLKCWAPQQRHSPILGFNFWVGLQFICQCQKNTQNEDTDSEEVSTRQGIIFSNGSKPEDLHSCWE